MPTEAVKVSIIMATGSNRLEHLRRTLISWSNITYPKELVEFILINTDIDNPHLVRDLAKGFDFICKIAECPQEDGKDWARVSRAWTREGKASSGEYVIFAMADELLGDYGVIDFFLSAPTTYRSSMRNYFLSKEETNQIDTMDWKTCPSILESFPDFWTHRDVEGADITGNEFRTTMPAKIYSHITGAPRKHWEYMGWFRTDSQGYFWLDNDVYFREEFLERSCHTLEGIYCYHQWHPLLKIGEEDRDYGGYKYETVEQCRLLAPAQHLKSGEYK